MTAHWIDIGGSEAQPRWELRQRVLGSYPVQEARIDHEGACSLSMLQSHAHFSIFGGCWLILFFVCTIVARLALQQCELFGLYVDFPAIVTNCGGNVAKAFNSTLQWDWLRCGCHLIHNVVKAGLDCLKNNAANPAQQSAVTLQEALDRLVVLYVHSMVASCMFQHPAV